MDSPSISQSKLIPTDNIANYFIKVLCEGITYSNWPWGTQTCNLNFGSWTHDATSYDLQFYGGLVMIMILRGKQQILINSFQEKMDLRQFGNHNQFKILKQEGLREVKR